MGYLIPSMPLFLRCHPSSSNDNRVAGKLHPNIFEVIVLFKQGQASVEVKIVQLEAGGRALLKSICICMDQRLKEMKTRLESGECSLAEYVSAIGHFTGL